MHVKIKVDIAGDHVIMSCQCLQYDIYMSLDFVQEFSLILNLKWFYNSGMIIIGFLSDWYETISYAVVCDDLCEVIKGEKLPIEIKRAVQVEITEQVQDSAKSNVHSKMVDVLSRVTPSIVKEGQEEDVNISKMTCYIKFGKKPKLAEIWKIKSRPVQRYLC